MTLTAPKLIARRPANRCAWCHERLGDWGTTCRDCGTVVHAACQTEAASCVTLGCTGAEVQVQRLTPPEPRPRGPLLLAAAGALIVALACVDFASDSLRATAPLARSTAAPLRTEPPPNPPAGPSAETVMPSLVYALRCERCDGCRASTQAAIDITLALDDPTSLRNLQEILDLFYAITPSELEHELRARGNTTAAQAAREVAARHPCTARR